MNKQILVIDDDAAIRKSFHLALEDTAFKVDSAESGEKGIEMERQVSYDLIFLDLKMPGLNGVETLRKIRENNQEVPVYIITAFHDEYFADLKKIQADRIHFELLAKPLDSGQIVAITQAVLGGPRSQKP